MCKMDNFSQMAGDAGACGVGAEQEMKVMIAPVWNPIR